ncbi:eukaryotic translation initiation factor 2B subunit beta [Carabus blaptoides fortunei]
MPALNEETEDVTHLISDISHGKLRCSYSIAERTESLVENIIANGQWKTAKELMELLALQGRSLLNALPQEAVPPNVIRHILKIIREEYLAKFQSSKVEGEQSLHHLLTAAPDDSMHYEKSMPSLKNSLIDHLAEYKVELETSLDNIASQASEHIHSNEIIMTLGKSNTVEKFLKSAAKTRKFQVIVVEAAPQCQGHEMSVNLGKSNIQTTVISDSAVFAMMARVNKVIIGTHTVMANGGLRAACGSHAIALAAKHYSVPVMVLAPMYKLNPVHLCSYEQDAFNICASPAAVLPFSAGPITAKVHIYNPVFDYVPPELVTLFISHQGGNAPSYVYRLITELYHPDDYDL